MIRNRFFNWKVVAAINWLITAQTRYMQVFYVSAGKHVYHKSGNYNRSFSFFLQRKNLSFAAQIKILFTCYIK